MAYMRKNKAKIKTYYKVFLESGLQYSLECSSKHLLQVSDKMAKGGADVSWSNLILWIAQLLHVNIAPPATSICLVYSTVNNLHANIAPPPSSSCHFSLSFAISV